MAIHAGKTTDLAAYAEFANVLAEHGYSASTDLPTGSVIALVDLVECHKIVKQDRCEVAETHKGTKIDGDEYMYGFYEVGRYAWELTNIKVFPQPILAKGQLRLWNWVKTPNL